MKFLPWLLMLATAVSAQTSANKILERGLAQAVAGMTPVPPKEKAEILNFTGQLLARHMTFRTDGTASAFHSLTTRRAVEWKGFTVKHITAQAVTEADRLNGISKRYLVGFACDAHRTWDTKTNNWGEWHAIGNPMFPSGIFVEWKDGAWSVKDTSRLKHFTPGLGAAVRTPVAASKRTGKDADLPPGMSRGR